MTRKCDVKQGYTNLLSHIKKEHPNYLDVYNAEHFERLGNATSLSEGLAIKSETRQSTLSYMIDTKSSCVFKWLEWVIMGELELNFCEKSLTRSNTSLGDISTKTLKKYMFRVVSAVRKRITAIASEAPRYALIIHGWKENSTDFLGVFMTCPGTNVGSDPHIFLLTFAPLLDGTSFSAKKHAQFLRTTLECYALPIKKLFCLIGDDCSKNKATANEMFIPLLGCRSHRFNLAVESYISKNLAEESEMVGQLITKLKSIKESGRLLMKIKLHPINRNITRWTDVANMLNRFEVLLPHVDQKNIEIATLIPTAPQLDKIRQHKQALINFKSVAMELQKRDTTILASHALFESVIMSYPEFDFESFIGTAAEIIHAPLLEIAIIKIQEGKEVDLTTEEKLTVQNLLKPASNDEYDNSDSETSLSFAERVLKKRRAEKSDNNSAYIDTTFLFPTSNDVERLFSLSKRLLSDSRKMMQPRTLEALVFMNQNRSLWNLALVSTVVNEKPDEDIISNDEGISDDEDTDDGDEFS